ncbi:alpha-galactosidase [Arthrobacter sp. APC 3897]|nr:alpha-galactosidase [Arthrobacter sp. APC 3897]MDN3482002.1 alpha-galactosidase [Arthrobacter sp. APC 3897]
MNPSLLSAGPALHLRSGGTSVVLDTTTSGLPTIVWWGADLGDVGDDVLNGLLASARPQRVSGGIDEPARLTLLPQESTGWQGTPAILGSRSGRGAFSAFSTTAISAGSTDSGANSAVVVSAVDVDAHLELTIELALDSQGLLQQVLTLTNTHPGAADDASDAVFDLVELAAVFPVPAAAAEILDTTGRHLRERTPQRHALTTGRYDRESRRGRPGADATLLLAAGTRGFGFERGMVHAVHLAWSGNHRLSVERTVTGLTQLRAAELLTPGEVRLAPGESYATPPAVASWGDGLTELSGRFHGALRARPHHPSTPRPVTLNTWEAVYFDHDLTRLSALADAGARVGVERFVLDDGWFRGRRDDTAGLGDWQVDKTVWPHGLSPLIDHVSDLGMQFGLWVEPEMVNPDSDLAREHPDWILGAGPHLPVSARQQQVLDLSNPSAWQHILEQLDAILTEYDIAYLKWDHNRDLLEAFSPATGRPAVHENVAALYRLLDELKARHPGVEIESCASGGARVDLGILEHTDRIWTSDCIDPLERLTIQKYTNLLVPYELMGAHISGPQSHSTGRRHDLALRAGVALPGHFGIEWDLTVLNPEELDEVAAWVETHKNHRDLLHTGRAVFADLADDTADVRGVIAADGSSALFTYTQVAASASYPAAPVTFPGLDENRRYRVRLTAPTAELAGPGQSPLAWTLQPIILTGRMLRSQGLQSPVLFPEQLLLIEFTAVD